MSQTYRLPTPALAVAGLALIFGRYGLFLTLIYIFSLFALEGLDQLFRYVGLTSPVTYIVTRTLTLSAFVIGLAVHYFLTGRTYMETPRSVTPLVAILAISAIYGLLAFTNLEPIVNIVYGTVISMWNYVVQKLFGYFGNFFIITLALYILIIPRVARWVVDSKLSLLPAGFVASIFSMIVSTISIDLTLTAYNIARSSLDMTTWSIFAITIGIAGFLELRRAVESGLVELFMQLPAIITIASFALPYLGQFYSTVLTALTLMTVFIMDSAVLVGLALDNKRAFVIGSVLAGALSSTYYALAKTLVGISIGHVYAV